MDSNEDLYFDNQDDEQLLGEENDSIESEESDDNEGSEQQGRGDLNIALRKEREALRQLKEQAAQREAALKEQLAQRDVDIQRREALLQQLGQPRREAPQVDQNAMRQALADSLLERPDQVFAERDNNLLSQVQQFVQKQNAPLYIRSAKAEVAEDPEFGEFYKTRPGLKKAADAWIENSVATYGHVDPRALKETLNYLVDIAREGIPTQAASTSNDAAKKKLNSVADKSNGVQARKTVDQILEEKSVLAKKNPKEYLKWADSPEGTRVLNEALKSWG
jgi:hypothetical protein